MPLTRREVEVALLVSEGLTNREIATRLFISERTAEHHVEQIRNKLGYHSRAQIAAWTAELDLRNLAPPPARRRPSASPAVETARRHTIRRRGLVAGALGALTSLTLVAAGFLVYGALAPASGGEIETIAGSGSAVGQPLGGHSGDNGPAIQAQLSGPTGVAVAPNGDVYIAEGPNGILRRIDRAGIITTAAGGGTQTPATGMLATDAALGNPSAVAVASDGDVIFTADSGVLALRPDSTVAVLGRFGDPNGLAVGADGAIFVADDGTNQIWELRPEGQWSVLAGTGQPGYLGDGGAAAAAMLDQPVGLAVDGRNRLYVADSGNDCVRVVDLTSGLISRVAGQCGAAPGSSGDGGLAVAAKLNLPTGLAVGPGGALYVADTGNNVVRRVRHDGVIETVAGTGRPGLSSERGPALRVALDQPAGLAYDKGYGLLIADSLNQRIRKLAV